jgi:hypothetical protein
MSSAAGLTMKYEDSHFALCDAKKATAKAGIPELLKRLAPLSLVARARRVWHGPSHRARLLCAALLMTASSFGLSMAVASLGAL